MIEEEISRNEEWRRGEVSRTEGSMAHLHSREREQRALFRVYLFGPFRVLRRGQVLDEHQWRRNKAKSLLKWFLLHPNSLYSADQLVDLFWPDRSEETSHRNLHVTMHALRHVLEPELVRGQESSFIHRTTSKFYQFYMDDTWWIDAVEVERFYQAAKRYEKLGELERAVFYYREVISYCKQEILPEDVYEECFQPSRRQYQRYHSAALTRLIEIALQNFDPDDVLEYAYQALLLDPYFEPAIRAIVQVTAGQGDIAGAIRKLDEFQGFLRQELHVEPSKNFRVLRDAIVSGY